jgi:Na+-transporting methylmalonyl-CoA/oxaloacetate decarboxylase gamma subunit
MLATTSASSSAAPGTLAFIVIFGLVVILVFVFRSMSKHIRKVNDAARREEDARAASSASAEDPATPPGTASPASAENAATPTPPH